MSRRRALITVAASWVHLVGLVPLAIGIVRLRDVLVARPSEAPGRTSTGRGTGEVAAVTISSGGDNLGAYAPFFATRPMNESLVIVGIAVLMTGLWCFIGFAVARQPRTQTAVRRWGRVLMPLVLIAIGVNILTAG